MGIFSIFKAAPTKTVDDLFDKDSGLIAKTGAWIGNGKFTAEEQAEHNAQIAVGVQKFVVDTLSESTDRSKARRNIAELAIKFHLLCLFMAGMTFPIMAEWSQVWFDISTSSALAGLVISISIFFFGSHAVAKFQGAIK